MKSKLYPISCSAQTQDAEVAQENIWLRFPHFLVAGGVSTALHWSTMAVLVASGLPGVWATSVGAAAGALRKH
jgi:putative flippase GtrA